jgi:hypothetical protein
MYFTKYLQGQISLPCYSCHHRACDSPSPLAILSLFDEVGATTDCRFCDCDDDIVGRAPALRISIAASLSFCCERRRDCSGMLSVSGLSLPPALPPPLTLPSEAGAGASCRRARLMLPSPQTTLHSGITLFGPIVTPAQILVCAPIVQLGRMVTCDSSRTAVWIIVECWMCVWGEIWTCLAIVMGLASEILGADGEVWLGVFGSGVGDAGFELGFGVDIDDVEPAVAVELEERSCISGFGIANSATPVPPTSIGPPITAFSEIIQ